MRVTVLAPVRAVGLALHADSQGGVDVREECLLLKEGLSCRVR